jgi:hypothetical protein
VSILHLPATADVLLLYPSCSLKDQIVVWASRHPERQVETSFERSLPEIRKLLRNAGAAMIDATADPGQATDAFLQAVARLGADAVVMYTEKMYDDLELFVRVRSSLFLLGPLFDEQWEEFFDRSLRKKGALPCAEFLRPPQPRRRLLPGRRKGQRQLFVNRFANPDWPITDIN